MPDDDDERPKRGMRFDPSITIGNVAQIGLILIGLITWAIAASNRSEQSGKDLVVLQERLTSQITDLRGTLTGGLSDVRTQIATLPDQRATLENTTRRLNDVEQRFGGMDKRIGELDRATIECRADLNTIMRQANVPLPRGRQ